MPTEDLTIRVLMPESLLVGNRTAVKNAVMKELDAGATTICLDLAACNYSDSSGLGMLVSLSKKASDHQAVLYMAGTNQDLEILLELTKLDSMLDVRDSPGSGPFKVIDLSSIGSEDEEPRSRTSLTPVTYPTLPSVHEKRTDNHVMIADTDDRTAELGPLLEEWGYRVTVVQNGEEILREIRRSPPDVLLIAPDLPTVSGSEVIQHIKGNETYPFIATVILANTPYDRALIVDIGADDYVVKPIDAAELKVRLIALLRIKALTEVLEERERLLLESHERLRHMSRTDGLTGLDNRRYLDQQLDRVFAEAAALKEPFACIMCDIDHFKSVNDTYDHHVGDAVLKQFARILRNRQREIDRVARYGGEEFAVLLPGVTADAAAHIAEKLREAIAAHTFKFDGGSLKRTASFGVAAMPHALITKPDDLMRKADRALMVAKKSGRNRVIVYSQACDTDAVPSDSH